MKKFILGFVSAVGLVLIYLVVRGFLSGGGPVSPENLKSGVKDYGSLRVEIFGKEKSLNDVEIDLGKVGTSGPTGPMSFAISDANGLATFEKVPVGDYDIFFNSNHFPSGYVFPQRVPVSITKNQVTQKRIDLAPQR